MSNLQTRFIEPSDIPALLALEHSKWESDQSADGDTLLQRIQTYPELCIGCFCQKTGTALASLFMCPIDPAIFTAPTRWNTAADVRSAQGIDARTRSLFGISLSSNDADAVEEIFRFFYPRALKAGWRDVYLGSPIPGFKKARAKNPALSVWQYVHSKKAFHSQEPLNAQLRYYFKKGFKHIVSIQQDYFPHAESLDYGVILRCPVPMSRPRILWQFTPFALLQPVAGMLYGIAR